MRRGSHPFCHWTSKRIKHVRMYAFIVLRTVLTVRTGLLQLYSDDQKNNKNYSSFYA